MLGVLVAVAIAAGARAEGAEAGLVATKYAQLHALGAGEGDQPSSGTLVKGPDGNFYGTTYYGGASDHGTVYRMAPNGAMQVLYSFTGLLDGGSPQGLTYRNGQFYGVTSGGGANGCGTFYRMGLDGDVSVIQWFGQGRSPLCHPRKTLMLSSDGHFYGISVGGDGALYRISAAGATKVRHVFSNTGADGSGPLGAPVEDGSGNLYGTTQAGGVHFAGILYRISKAGGPMAVLHSFAGISGDDGAEPYSGLVWVGRMLYGTTYKGGAFNGGTVYRVSPSPGGAYQVVHSFSYAPGQPREPCAGLVYAPDGQLYGTTCTSSIGGFGTFGTVYRITLDGQLTLLHTFGDLPRRVDGAHPGADLLLVGSSTFYGTTLLGGASDRGTVFKLSVVN
ncbi:choice-of-anchor tandem repeat GloVer-containing protein [Ideonella sp. YS5]